MVHVADAMSVIGKEQFRVTRPYIFCHMMTSLDGKIMGNYMNHPAAAEAGEAFYRIAFGEKPYYRHQGWLSGRVTTDDNFTFYEKPALEENALPVPDGDFAAPPDFGMYYVSIDPAGRLGWKDAVLHYETTTAHVIEVLTARASNTYKSFLRRLGISYIIAGEETLDATLALQKLRALFHINTLMLGGGAVLNWSFIQAGLCDEVSVVIAPCADGSASAQTLFMEKPGISDDTAAGFTLLEAKSLPGSAVWLRYKVERQGIPQG